MAVPAMDRYYETHPGEFKDILRGPEPERTLGVASPPELYNLADDHAEQHNVAEQFPDITHRMLRELDTWFEEVEQERQSTGEVLNP